MPMHTATKNKMSNKICMKTNGVWQHLKTIIFFSQGFSMACDYKTETIKAVKSFKFFDHLQNLRNLASLIKSYYDINQVPQHIVHKLSEFESEYKRIEKSWDDFLIEISNEIQKDRENE